MALWNPLHRVALVRTTVGRKTDAQRLARRLIDGRLAACVHVSEVASVYRWKGAVQEETEFLVEARTTTRRRGAVEAAMLEGHPYEVPLVETAGRPALVPANYKAWVDGEVR